MKVIISHDVDHLNVTEHLSKDIFIPKLILRNHIDLVTGSLKLSEYFLRWKNILNNKMENIKEIVKFDKENEIPSTFFFGMNNDLSLSYSFNHVKKWVIYVEKNGFATGVHGINYKDYNLMLNEYNKFKSITSQKHFGIRMHYLRNNQEMFKKLFKIGYVYDFTLYLKKPSHIINGLLCFPLHIMDCYEVLGQNKFINLNFEDIKKKTLNKIDEFINLKIDYLSINFHDVYFSKSYKLYHDWYIWLIKFLKKENLKFINYDQAINEIRFK